MMLTNSTVSGNVFRIRYGVPAHGGGIYTSGGTLT